MRTLVSIPASIIVLSISIPALAQQSRPSPDLDKENKELNEYIDRLESRLGELKARVRELDKTPARPPYWFELPQVPERHELKPFPWRLTPPSTRPAPKVAPAPRSQVAPPFAPAPPPGARRYRFNGQDVYIIPLQLQGR